MILQPIYENAIKHGVNESTDTVTISTQCTEYRGDLRISIGNNYSPGNISKRGQGLGLENIKKRLKLHFKRSDLLEIEKSSFYFTVHITIPKVEQDKTTQ